MSRHPTVTRCLHEVMYGVDCPMWSGSTPGPVTLKTVGASSAVIDSVEDLISMCEQARCGVDGKTVTDLTVRNTLRVAADRVSVEWPALSEAVEDCAAHLGLGSGVTAQLHDVLVYRPGDFFKRHVDSIKHPHHRATLVLDTGLPAAPFVGGVLHVEDKSWVSCGAGSYAAWHTNAEHYVTELASGHRVVAMYNLLHKDRVLPELIRDLKDGVSALQTLASTKGLSESSMQYYLEFDSTVGYFELPNVPSRDDAQYASVDERIRWTHWKRIPGQDFVGFWLLRQYPSSSWCIRRSILGGADADLVWAVAEAFDVPLEHIQCRVEWMYEGEGDTRDFTCRYEDQHLRVAFVEGEPQKSEGEEVGMAVGNDVEHPVYECHASYLRFHVKYLKDYIRRCEMSDARANADASDGTAADVPSSSQTNVGGAKSILVQYLQNNAAVYANQFCNEAWKKADERFFIYAAK
ncbi:Hypothetical protein, putative [Bodo saltans]|uniref:Prolyl 4-hydroxylase alpha subunit Fe(2+) 2OG dioxygenase domain-containing protein n=1 Tax=Bodo saltans TaxID=75058 RepID=A0A0S4KQY2_BODSA|nr:Hypothetical protein, putative [Bodo saltans]|eukprot:CUI15360.1 Hypothetical protein, putative [Bodo saltans]